MYDTPQQYFDPNQGGKPEGRPPVWRSSKLWLGVVAALVVAGLVVFLVNVFSRVDRDAGGDDVAAMEAQLAVCGDDPDPQECEVRVRTGAARSTADAALCEGLTEAEYASCVVLAAKQSGDTSACDDIAGDEQRASCENLAWLTVAKDTVDAEVCARITDSDMLKSCMDSITAEAVALGTCAAAHIDTALCDERAILDAAIAQGTREACAALEDDQGAEIDCINAIASIDADDDGLALVDEVEAGTDPAKADTDGDGYTDGEEVKNGYDPLN